MYCIYLPSKTFPGQRAYFVNQYGRRCTDECLSFKSKEEASSFLTDMRYKPPEVRGFGEDRLQEAKIVLVYDANIFAIAIGRSFKVIN